MKEKTHIVDHIERTNIHADARRRKMVDLLKYKMSRTKEELY